VSQPFTWETWKDWPLKRIIAYMEATPTTSWTTDVVCSKDGQNCFYGHLHAMGGGDDQMGGSHLWDFFEECFATTYMLYPVNDGQDPDYPQPTAKARVIAYLKDLDAGKKKTTAELMEEYHQQYKDNRAQQGRK